MQTKRILFVLILSIAAFSVKLKAQNEIIHFAYFVDTQTNVYRDLNDRLVMNFTITNVVDLNDLESVRYKFEHYGAFESVQFTSANDPGVFGVYCVSVPGVKIKSLRKLFVSCGVFTLFIDDQPYPSADFSVKMLNTD